MLQPTQLLHNDTIVSIATKYSGKTAAHILLRWAVQQGIGTLCLFDKKVMSMNNVNRERDNNIMLVM